MNLNRAMKDWKPEYGAGSSPSHGLLQLLCVFVLSLGSAFLSSQACGQTHHVIIHTKDGNESEGVLLEMTPYFVRFDPVGPVSIQIFYANEIENIYIRELDRKISYPLQDSISTTQDNNQSLIKNTDQSVFHDEDPIYARNLSLFATLGPSWYSGKLSYESRAIAQIGVRYHFPKVYLGGLPSFWEVSYSRTSLHPKIEHPVQAEENSGPIDLQLFGISTGMTARTIDRYSYLDFQVGLTYLLVNGGSRVGFRIGPGGVFGLNNTISIIFNGLLDVTSKGGVFYINIGLLYDFNL